MCNSAAKPHPTMPTFTFAIATLLPESVHLTVYGRRWDSWFARGARRSARPDDNPENERRRHPSASTLRVVIPPRPTSRSRSDDRGDYTAIDLRRGADCGGCLPRADVDHHAGDI